MKPPSLKRPGRPRSSAIEELKRQQRRARFVAAQAGLDAARLHLQARETTPSGPEPTPAEQRDMDALKRFLVALLRQPRTRKPEFRIEPAEGGAL